MTNREWLSRLSNKELEEWLCDEMYDHGEWIREEYFCVCSNCQKYFIPIGDEYDFNFCPNCGANMRGKAE